jgi:GxxExxY protein
VAHFWIAPTIHQDLTETVIGCAFEVYNSMGFGFLEKVYENCLVIELTNKGLNTQTQKSISVQYKGKTVGDYFADIVVENQIILEIKSVSTIVPGS